MKSEGQSEQLEFLGTDPGAVKFGNFINYYSFHNVEERTSKLHRDMFPIQPITPIYCLDVGCNTGDLTKALYHYLKSIYPHYELHILGIDIDPKLIQRAEELNDIPTIKYVAANIMDDMEILKKYLKTNDVEKFDIIFCFSVTMWIHLNNGDNGLIEFLKMIMNLSSTIVIEPQPWNCYRNAQRRLKKSGSTFQYYENLKIRSNVDIEIERILSNDKFKKVYESPHSSWNRKIQSYHCMK